MHCAVICPVYLTHARQIAPLWEMIESLCRQTDDGWQLVLVDDRSDLDDAPDVFADVIHRLGRKVELVHRAQNAGQGQCRNIGARWAWERRVPICIYLDADDRADPRRIETVRRVFDEDRRADFLYSTFDLIDQDGSPVPPEHVAPSIEEILHAHRQCPPAGRSAWLDIAIRHGYSTLTSTVSVRTWLAMNHPFPAVYVSEDQHAWLRMTAAIDGVVFDSQTRGQYRVTTDGSGSSVRRRIGEDYYEQKAWVDTDGFLASIPIALSAGKISAADIPATVASFYTRSAQTLAAEMRPDAAAEYLDLSQRVGRSHGTEALTVRPTQPRMFAPSHR